MEVERKMDFTIVTQGQRIREIRKKLNLKQEDLSGDIITRNLISMIETDKASLTTKAAEVIYDNFKRAVNGKNFGTDLKIDEIFITEEDQAKKIYNDFLEHIEVVGVEAEELLDDMISIVNKYDLNYMKVYIYGDLGRAFRLKGDFTSAYNYFSMANEFIKMCYAYNNMSNIDINYYGMLMTTLTYCFNRLGKYEEGIQVCDNIIMDIPSSITKKINFNKILMLKSLGKYNEALKVIDKLENKSNVSYKELDNDNLEIKIQIIKGNCYREQGYLNKALRTYKQIFQDIKDIEEQYKNRFLILSNIMEVSVMLDDDYEKNCNRLLKEIHENKESFEENYFASEIYKWIAYSYEYKKEENNMKEAYGYILKSLYLAKRDRNMDIIEYDLNKLIQYIPEVEECTIEEVQKHIETILQSKMIKADSKVIMKLINLHMINNNQEEVQNIIELCKSEVS